MILIFGYLVIPALLIFLCQRLSLLDKLGVVPLSVGLGIAIAATIDLSHFFSAGTVTAVQSNVSEISIALALPLLLFSIDVKGALNMAGDTLKGMGLALLSVVLISFLGAIIFNDRIDAMWQVAGMSVGAYTGGGPNMAAIKAAIGGDESVFITMVTYDILFSGMYLLFVMTIGQRLFGLFLRPYQSRQKVGELDYAGMEHMVDESANSYKKLVELRKLPQSFIAMVCSALVVGASLGLSTLAPDAMRTTTTIVTITTLGLGCSFIPAVRNLANSFQLGGYLILIFCFTSGTMVNANIITELDYSLAGYITFILVGSLVLQALLCKLLDIDNDTFLITSSAAIMSVPFIPAIAGSLKNREILLPGFAAAIIGYAAGNYLGIIVANTTRWLLGT